MTTIAIIYFSGTGHAHLMAEAIAEGAQKTPDVWYSSFGKIKLRAVLPILADLVVTNKAH